MIRNKNILFIAYFFPPVGGTGLPGANRIIRFINYLNLKDTHVLTVKPECYPKFVSITDTSNDKLNHVQIHRTGVFNIFDLLLKIRQKIRKNSHKQNNAVAGNSTDGGNHQNQKHRSFFQKMKDVFTSLLNYPDFANPWLIPAIYHGRRIILRNNIDVIFATGMPWSSLIIGYFLKILTGKLLICDFRDPWTTNPYLKKSKIEQYLDKTTESKVLRMTDVVIANTQYLEYEFESRYSNIKDKFITVLNGYDKTIFNNIPKITLEKDKLNIVHAGSLYLKRDPITFLKAIARFNKKYPRYASQIQFIQIGKVVLDYDLEEYCQKFGIFKNVRLLKQMPHRECIGYLSASDILLIIQPDTRTQIPSKLFEYIYLEKLILSLALKDGALGHIIGKYNLGKLFGSDEYELLADYFYLMVQQKIKQGELTISYPDKEKFDSESIITQFQDRLEQREPASGIMLNKGENN